MTSDFDSPSDTSTPAVERADATRFVEPGPHAPETRSALLDTELGGGPRPGNHHLPLLRSTTEPPLRLGEPLAEGGMGEVLAGEQVDLGRPVAIKRVRRILLDGPDHSLRIREFVHEARVTALLEHPNIMPVHDLVRDPADGNPLLVMKRVDGEAWSEILDREFETLNVDEFLDRHLAILERVTQAVAFAHSRGIVHRDLKPSQVMVGEYGEVLLMDWGLAIFVGDEAGPTRARELGLVDREHASNSSGTPALMAPEQTERSAAGIGPWTDVYQLGGILYALLTGRFPHSCASGEQTLHHASLGLVEPPSEESGDREVPEDLEGLCLEALAADPTDRCPSAEDFRQRLVDHRTGTTRRRSSRRRTEAVAEEVERLPPGTSLEPRATARLEEIDRELGGALREWSENPRARSLRRTVLEHLLEDALARRDVTGARVRLARLRAEQAEPGRIDEWTERVDREKERLRAERRRRSQIRVAVVVLTILVAGLGWSAWSQARTREAFESWAALRSREDDLARRIAAAAPLPRRAPGSSTESVRVDRGLLDHLLSEREALRAERNRIVDRLPARTRVDQEPWALLLAEANLSYHGALSADDLRDVRSLYASAVDSRPDRPEPRVGAALTELRLGSSLEAARLLDGAAERSAALYGATSLETARIRALAADAWGRLDPNSTGAIRSGRESLHVLAPAWIELSLDVADRERSLGGYADALARTSEALRMLEAEPGDPDRVAEVLSRRASLEIDLDDLPAAEEDLRRALEIAEEDSLRIHLQTRLATVLRRSDRFEEAETLLRATLELERGDGVDRPVSEGEILNNLAVLLRNLGRPDESVDAYAEAAELLERGLGPDHPDVATVSYNLGRSLRDLGRLDEARAHLDRALDIRTSTYGPDHPELVSTLQAVGNLDRRAGRLEKSLELLRRATDISSATFGPEHTDTAKSLVSLSATQFLLGLPGAEESGRRAVRILLESYGPDHRWVAIARDVLGRSLLEQERWAEALELFDAALATRRRLLGDSHPETATTLLGRGRALRELGRLDEARTALAHSLAVHDELFGSDDPRTVEVHRALVDARGAERPSP